jgi:hypothetical protein
LKQQGQVRHKKRGSGEVTTHKLERAEKGTSQNMQRKQEIRVNLLSEEHRAKNQPGHGRRRGVREGNSLPGECVGRIKSLQERKKASERARGTHKLERAELQVRVLKQTSEREAVTLTFWKDSSGYRWNANERKALTN